MNKEAMVYLNEFHTADTDVLIRKGTHLIFLSDATELKELKKYAECIPAKNDPDGEFTNSQERCDQAKQYV